MRHALIVMIVMIGTLLSSSIAMFAQPAPGGDDNDDGPPRRPQFQPRQSLLTVSGHGESAAKPDRAIVRLGAVAQANAARDAEEQVNEIVQKSLDAIKQL